MNFILFIIISLITFILTQFAGTQIIGIIFIKIPEKDYKTIIGLLLWSGILYLYYLAITTWFNAYFQVYLWCSIIALVISLLNLKNLKSE